ncbi:bifunctional folylpolyglutamate synthase/dihydrofolate synthase [Brucepastera parasyntrophica]|uniref:bifunctional folylpolyglutamate synthase/dihydrofolate synthase n=1 Tax=Brucepastera parasyntrophica TaxID=2880008 RepID=UPI00210C3763|nr:Mur ligase family protein [Brucepastera parasyntrophica]ULQ60060.1 bifunctional folylpolyglutamate synthase/dihydrofolate synthase [Brucepastera parasyntrophica]
MEFLVARFKNPEKKYNTVHIAGSKGKGSVSAMLTQIFSAAGYTAGLYTSPHILDFTERVSSAAGIFSDEMYGKASDLLVPLVESIIPENLPGGNEPTWFELVTLFAFLTFREAVVDWAVIETGMGGRLDATNVITPAASIITPIEMEHMEFLGDTLGKIAGEKAGIIKHHTPVFVSPQQEEALKVLTDAAKYHSSPFFYMQDIISSISSETSQEGNFIFIEYKQIPEGPVFSRPLSTRLRFLNEIQAQNAAIAAYTAKFLLPDITESMIETGLSRAWLPGRFELIPGDVPIVLDGAHTVKSISTTLTTFKKLFPGNNHLLFACAADKNVDAIAELFHSFSEITITKPGDFKETDMEKISRPFLELYGSRKVTLTINEDYQKAIPDAILSAYQKKIPLLVIGSFYLVSEVKKILVHRTGDQENLYR